MSSNRFKWRTSKLRPRKISSKSKPGPRFGEEGTYRPGPSLQLAWNDYKTDNGSLSVRLGSFNLYVLPIPRLEKDGPPRYWQVAWFLSNRELTRGKMRGLTDRRFPTRLRAQKAAEQVFVPVAMIARDLVEVMVDVQKSIACWNPRAKDKPWKTKKYRPYRTKPRRKR